jgi:hypothetical protein
LTGGAKKKKNYYKTLKEREKKKRERQTDRVQNVKKENHRNNKPQISQTGGVCMASPY